MANWRNLEKQLEQASRPSIGLEPAEIYNMRMALIQWPGMKTVIEELIKRDRAHMKADRERRAHEKRQQAIISQVLFDR